MSKTVLYYLLLTAFLGYIAKTAADNGTMTGLSSSTSSELLETSPKISSTIATTVIQTEPPVTPPNIPTFTATSGDDVCMIISLDATVTLEGEEGEEFSSRVPEGAEISKSPAECSENATTAYIELLWANEDQEWTLGLGFEVTEEGDQYTLVLANGSLSVEGPNGTNQYNWNQDEDLGIPKVPVGQSVHCKDVYLDNIDFREYQFQPFAQESGGEFGEVMECDEDSGLDMIWIIVISVASGVFVIALTAGIVQFCKKRKQTEYETV